MMDFLTFGLVCMCFGLTQARTVHEQIRTADTSPALDWAFYAQVGSMFIGTLGGGSLINQKYFLTSASTFQRYPPWLQVYPGYFKDVDASSSPFMMVLNVVFHPNHTHTSSDVALAKLVDDHYGATVSLNTDPSCPAAGTVCTAVLNLQDGGVYRKVPVQVLDQQSCTRLGYGSDLLCVRRQNSPSAQCAFHSGSPLMCSCNGQHVQVAIASGAIASGGRGCDSNGIYTYTRVTAVKQWIDQNSRDLD